MATDGGAIAKLGPGLVVAGKYAMVALLGRGGMGEVWRARHVALGSHVALKFLDPRLAQAGVSRSRFLREAKAAAALRSPHVIQIHDYGVDGDTPFIAMELLEGESLAARLREGPLAPDVAWRVGDQILRAVAKAHEAGIVHRDLKPANVFITPNEAEDDEVLRRTWLVKVLDFGIAKQLDVIDPSAPTEAGGAPEQSTESGAILGTPHYMSPEQVRSKPVDARSDLWSVGVMVYECLLGRRPFESGSFGSLVLEICAEPLPLPSDVGTVPKGFDDWFAKALARDPEARFQSAREMSQALRAVLAPGEAASRNDSVLAVPVYTRKSQNPRYALAVATVALCGAALWWGTRPAARVDPPASATPSATPPIASRPSHVARQKQLTFVGKAETPVVAPDGSAFYFVSSDGPDEVVWRGDLPSGDPREVARLQTVLTLAISVRGDLLISGVPAGARGPAEWASQKGLVLVVDPSGRAVSHDWGTFSSVSWSPTGDSFAGVGGVVAKKVVIQPLEGPRRTVAVDGDYQWMNAVQWAPDGGHLLVTTARGGGAKALWSVPAAGGPAVQVMSQLDAWDAIAPIEGALLVTTRAHPTSELERIPFDFQRGVATGPTELLLSGIRSGLARTGDLQRVSATTDGSLVVYAPVETQSNLWLVDAAKPAGPHTQLTRGTRRHALPQFSPDGSRLAFVRSGERGELFVMPSGGGPEVRLSAPSADVIGFAWAPDGQRIAMVARNTKAIALQLISADGGSAKDLRTDLDFAGDGTHLVSWGSGSKILARLSGNQNWAAIDPETGQSTPLLADIDGWVFRAQPSAQGDVAVFRNVASGSDDHHFGAWVVPTHEAPVRVADGRVMPLRWVDATHFYAHVEAPFNVTAFVATDDRSGRIVRVSKDGGPLEAVAAVDFRPNEITDLDITSDGNRIVASVQERSSDVWLVEGLATASPPN